MANGREEVEPVDRSDPCCCRCDELKEDPEEEDEGRIGDVASGEEYQPHPFPATSDSFVATMAWKSCELKGWINATEAGSCLMLCVVVDAKLR